MINRYRFHGRIYLFFYLFIYLFSLHYLHLGTGLKAQFLFIFFKSVPCDNQRTPALVTSAATRIPCHFFVEERLGLRRQLYGFQ